MYWRLLESIDREFVEIFTRSAATRRLQFRLTNALDLISDAQKTRSNYQSFLGIELWNDSGKEYVDPTELMRPYSLGRTVRADDNALR